ncbi:MAG: acetyl-CoA carboxylase, carboxyltransferase subunit beta [Alphaproteobacteria bacterium]|nr:acetyl-CoA carboxylase, carboxyltransferase subunit beta [Alphaproteobacteria bacterium]
MNWLTNFVRPKIRALVGSQKEIPDNLWEKCVGCNAMLFKRELEENLNVCRHCGQHMKLPPLKRLEMLFDEGAFTLVPVPKVIVDPLKFRDQKRYTERLKEAQSKTGQADAIMVGEGKLGGKPAVIAAFNFAFLGGSMGMAVGEGLVTAARRAIELRAAFIVVPASGGARMQEGMLSLMQMPRSIIAAKHVKDAGLPYIVVFTDPTTGGVTASFAMTGDVHIAEKGALIGFAGRRVIESIVREVLPPAFQRSEYLKDHGMIDVVVTRHELRETLVRVLDLLTGSDRRPQSGLRLTAPPPPHGARIPPAVARQK